MVSQITYVQLDFVIYHLSTDTTFDDISCDLGLIFYL